MGKVGVWVLYAMCFCSLLERVSEALRWSDNGASGRACLMYSVGNVNSR